MPIKYGELIIIMDTATPSLINFIIQCHSYFNADADTVLSDSKFIFSFEDDEIVYDNENIKDFNYKFEGGIASQLPYAFTKLEDIDPDPDTNFMPPTDYIKNPNPMFFKKRTKFNELTGHNTLNITPLFCNHKKYKTHKMVTSIFNFIYYTSKQFEEKECFGLLHIQSSNTMPMYLFAYDDEHFTKEETIYLIHTLVNNFSVYCDSMTR